jgi:osmoprotectant transport system permease protein
MMPILTLTLQHLQMLGISLIISLIVAWTIVAGVQVFPRLKSFVLVILGLFYTVPSLALVVVFLPLLGLNAKTVIAAVVFYSQVVLVRNILTALEQIDPTLREAAQALGMSGWQRWWRVELPLILPTFLAGVRLASVMAISVLTLGAKVNAGGLGRLLFDGIQTNRYDKILLGSLILGTLALGINALIQTLERRLSRYQL